MPTPLSYAQANRARSLDELIQFLKIPSISTQPAHRNDVAAAAAWLAGAMTRAGLENVRVIETAGHPLVYADWLHAGPEAPTVLLYGHYDVQPAEPFELWQTPPFDPVVRDDYLLARGASDDKGQAYIHVKAVEAYLQTEGRLPVNVKFIVEGEEESGGRNLAAFIPQQQALLAADIALVSDTAILAPDQPAIVYGLRGMCYVLLDLYGPRRDLHSGSYGGGINNPLNVLGRIMARLQDDDGRVLVPGFYDRVRPLSAAERALLAQLPFDEAAWLAETGAGAAWGDPDFTLVERLGARPTLDFHGLNGGYTGDGSKTVLPAHVHAKFSMRLVPDQDPREIGQLVETFLRGLLPPGIRMEMSVHGAPASITDVTIPAMQAAATAYEASFGKAPVFMREGGSIPVVGQFQKHLGLETVLMGFGLRDDRIHSPNERFYLPNFYRGIDTCIRFLEEYARAADAADAADGSG